MQLLLVVGFYLHALPMNVMLGGGFISAALFFIGRNDKQSYPFRAAKALAVSLPLFISFGDYAGHRASTLFATVIWTSVLYILNFWWRCRGFPCWQCWCHPITSPIFVVYRVLKEEDDRKVAGKAISWLLVMSLGFTVIGFGLLKTIWL